MNERKDDGGPAFPIPNDDRPGAYEAHPGMSLRDWFAGQAPRPHDFTNGEVTALIGHARYPAHEDYTGLLVRRAKIDAAWRYLWADAMLAERAKK